MDPQSLKATSKMEKHVKAKEETKMVKKKKKAKQSYRATNKEVIKERRFCKINHSSGDSIREHKRTSGTSGYSQLSRPKSEAQQAGTFTKAHPRSKFKRRLELPESSLRRSVEK